MNASLYFDYAAATPLDADVFAAMQPFLAQDFYNPSATYLPAVRVREELEGVRARVAHWLGARPGEVVFTAGGTEANNLAIRGIMDQFPDGNVVVSAIEHESVLATAHQYPCREAAVTPEGIVDVDALTSLVDDATVLVSVMYANNEVGTIQPIREIAQRLKAIRAARAKAGNMRPLYLHTDAAQAAAYLDIHTARLGVDLLTINAGKIYGPKQAGALFASSHVHLQAQVHGGGQERGLRSGTENVAGAIGLATALDLVQSRRKEESERLRVLQALFFDELARQLPGAQINGSRNARLPNNVHITIPGTDNERVLLKLEQQGILAAAGSACSASNEEPSHVLRAMGCTPDYAQTSLRFTMGHATTERAVNSVVQALRDIAS